MAAVPVIINGTIIPKGRSGHDKPEPAVFVGYLSIQGLEIGGGPILPDNPPPSGGDGDHIDNSLPIPPELPVDPPPGAAAPNAVLVVKPAPVTGGWGIAVDKGSPQWFFVPGEAGPKR